MKKSFVNKVRHFCFAVTLVLLSGAVSSSFAFQSAEEVKKRLADGNKRYSHDINKFPNMSAERRGLTAVSQHPIVTVMTCSDSRIPVENVFDQGIGDVFVVRVAGNVSDVDEIGSIEYGVEHLGTPLMIVLGHTNCGAVTAVVTNAEVHGSIPKLVDNIAPAVASAKEKHPDVHGKALVPYAIEENVWTSISDLIKGSHGVRERIVSGKVNVVGAIYDLESGSVQWLGNHPHQDKLLSKTANAKTGAKQKTKHESKKKTDHDAKAKKKNETKGKKKHNQ